MRPTPDAYRIAGAVPAIALITYWIGCLIRPNRNILDFYTNRLAKFGFFDSRIFGAEQ
jgi:hypothetical protein